MNVLQSFKPVLPPSYQTSDMVFLGNIDPVLQQEVLRQVKRPRLVACDTMNFWIEGKRDDLKQTLALVDIVIINDGEARELSKEVHLRAAARWILERGPRLVVIKKGEHGVLCFSKKFIFLAPAYLLEKVFDPTGAGDSFAGGFMGHLARTGDTSEANLRRAIVYGSVMASFAVEEFGVKRLLELTQEDIGRRFQEFKHLTHFDV